MNRTIIIAIVGAVIVVFVAGLGSNISKLTSLRFGNTKVSPSPEVSFSPLPSPAESRIPTFSPKPVVTPQKPTAYNGRPVDEVRPNPEEVKLFSESDKQELYRSLQNYGKSVKENPDFFSGWLQLGLLKKVIGDFEGARDAWDYAGVIRPLNDVSFANLGELYWRYLRLYPQSETNFKVAITNNPSNAGTYVSLSDLYYYSLKEKQDMADDIILQGIAVNPQSIDLPKALAALYERMGQYALAIEWWNKVLAQDPQNIAVASAIDSLKKKMGQ
ncbi:MAG: tetratricopeptide repeat protein [bacterium]|nr:tetratricopeptide repeat protein [bacterium]